MIVILLVQSVASRAMPLLLVVGVALLLATLAAVVLERALVALQQARRRSLERRFIPAIEQSYEPWRMRSVSELLRARSRVSTKNQQVAMLGRAPWS